METLLQIFHIFNKLEERLTLSRVMGGYQRDPSQTYRGNDNVLTKSSQVEWITEKTLESRR